MANSLYNRVAQPSPAVPGSRPRLRVPAPSRCEEPFPQQTNHANNRTAGRRLNSQPGRAGTAALR